MVSHTGKRSRRWKAAGAASVAILLLSVLLDLVTSELSSNGGALVKFIREHLVWCFAGILLVTAVLTLWLVRRQEMGPVEEDEALSTAESVRVEQRGNSGNVSAVGGIAFTNVVGDVTITTASLTSSGLGPTPAVRGAETARIRVLFLRKGPMDGKWRIGLVDTLQELQNQGLILADQVHDGDLVKSGVDLLIIIFGAPYYRKYKEDILGAIRECRVNNPAAEIFVLGCDLSETPLRRDTIDNALRTAQVGAGCECEVFPHAETDQFVDWLTAQINATVKTIRLAKSRAAIDLPTRSVSRGTEEGISG
ncbi:hypothetical protein ACFQX7_10005 [Luedemannella flava]